MLEKSIQVFSEPDQNWYLAPLCILLFSEYQGFVYCMCQESIPHTIMMPPIACSVIITSDGSNDFSLHQEWSSSKRNLDSSYQALISQSSTVHVWCFCTNFRRTLFLFCLFLFLFFGCSPFEARDSSSSCLLRWHSVKQCWIWIGFDGFEQSPTFSTDSSDPKEVFILHSSYSFLTLLCMRNREPAIVPNTLFIPRTAVTWHTTWNGTERTHRVKRWRIT